MFSVERLAQLVRGELLHAAGGTPRRAIHDSRLVRPDDLFVALAGSRSDGHQHLTEVFNRGARCAIVSDRDSIPANARNVIVVDSPALALQQLASAWRDELGPATFIAITGSNGKTTVKALLGHILSGSTETYISPRNYNTEIGLPLALLSMPSTSQFGVFELGAEKAGDISLLSRILRPDLAIITSIGASHLDGLVSVEAVAQEKWSLIEQLGEGGKAIVNAESQQLRTRASAAGMQVVTVGQDTGDVTGRTLQAIPHLTLAVDNGEIVLDCPIIGSHQATNVLLAATAARTLGVDWQSIQAQLACFTPVDHRLCALPAPFGTILDDTYNANPASTEAALHVLASYDEPSSKLFIFGEMGGLGDQTEHYHRKIAQLALGFPIDQVIPVGQAAMDACNREQDARIAFVPREQIADHVRNRPSPMTVLVKGSRHLQMETLVDELLGAD